MGGERMNNVSAGRYDGEGQHYGQFVVIEHRLDEDSSARLGKVQHDEFPLELNFEFSHTLHSFISTQISTWLWGSRNKKKCSRAASARMKERERNKLAANLKIDERRRRNSNCFHFCDWLWSLETFFFVYTPTSLADLTDWIFRRRPCVYMSSVGSGLGEILDCLLLCVVPARTSRIDTRQIFNFLSQSDK